MSMMKKYELTRIADNIIDIAESERDNDLKVEMVCMRLIEDLGIEIIDDDEWN